ncbi:NAD(P)-dependent oxidoreductase [Microbacterium sp. gxy059]|uniref:NAD(P)-dependent oxidoreductase n=1 Tax=Microbacterium sp. gxy059 TaxID=2957199 RepID=UPI003D984097
MSHVVVIGGTGYAGSAIAAEAAQRGHEVTAVSRSAPEEPRVGVSYVQGDVTDDATLASVIAGADIVVSALAPRGPLTGRFRAVTRAIARLADAEHARLFVVGGFSSLRPAPGEPRFIEDPSGVPDAIRDEVQAGAALIIEDLPATPESLDWVFVSPAQGFGSFAPGETLGTYRLGGDVAVDPETGGAISAPDYAQGFVDLIESGDHHRAQVNLAH